MLEQPEVEEGEVYDLDGRRYRPGAPSYWPFVEGLIASLIAAGVLLEFIYIAEGPL